MENLKKLFETDSSCSDVLKNTGLIEFSSEFTYAYIWNEKTLLYDKLVCDQYRCVISKILTKIFEQEITNFLKIKKQIKEEDYDGDDDLLKYDMKKEKQSRLWADTTKKLLQSSHKINSIVNMCGSMINAKCDEKYNTDKNNIPLKDGFVIDLRTSIIRKREKTDYFTYELKVGITANIDNANKFFSSLMNDDLETINRFQEVLGYCISKWTFLKKYFVFWGETGNNGKSELLSIMKLIFEPLCTSISEGVFADMNNKNENGPTPHLIQILNKNFGTYGEVSDVILKESTIKMITGQDTISVRRMRDEFFSTYFETKLILIGNDKPLWRANNPMRLRTELIPFYAKFVVEPKKTNEKLQDPQFIEDIKKLYLDEIFTWIIIGSKRIYDNYMNKDIKNKLTYSKKCEEASKEYYNEMNTTNRFFNLISFDQKNPMTKKEVFTAYNIFCSNNSICCEKACDFHKKLKNEHKIYNLHGNDVYRIDIKNYDNYNKCYVLDEEPCNNNIIMNLTYKDKYEKLLKEHTKILNENDKYMASKVEIDEERNEELNELKEVYKNYDILDNAYDDLLDKYNNFADNSNSKINTLINNNINDILTLDKLIKHKHDVECDNLDKKYKEMIDKYNKDEDEDDDCSFVDAVECEKLDKKYKEMIDENKEQSNMIVITNNKDNIKIKKMHKLIKHKQDGPIVCSVTIKDIETKDNCSLYDDCSIVDDVECDNNDFFNQF
jgi:phage/plasmid-associated DNA primase